MIIIILLQTKVHSTLMRSSLAVHSSLL